MQGTLLAGALGALVKPVGDLDGDGQADFCVNVFNAGALLTGVVHVYLSGSASGFEPALTLEGRHVTDEFGDALSGIGDLNGDGYDDLAVGTTHPASSAGYSEYWRVHVYLGGPNLGSSADWVIDHTRERGVTNGISISAIGDYNGDGYDDFAVSTVTLTSSTAFDHAAEIHLGAANAAGMAVIQLMSDPDEFGASISPAGDWDGDGFDDLAVGAPKGTGKVRVFGHPDRVLTTLMSPVPGDRFGHSITLVRGATPNEDILAVGAPLSTAGGPNSGEVRLFSKHSQLLRTITGAAHLEYGTALDASGDLNGDGLHDLIVGCPGSTFQRGEVHVFSGSATECSVASWISGQIGSRFGAAVALIPQTDGPLATVAIGSPNHYTSVRAGGRLDLHRVVRPRMQDLSPGHTVYPGERDTLRWMGTELVDLSISTDDAGSWTTFKRGIGGAEENELEWIIPSMPAFRARARLTLSGEVAHGSNSDVTRAFRIATPNPVSRVAHLERMVTAGRTVRDREGTRLAWMPDVDGDDMDEIVSGAPDAANGTGRVTLFLSGGGSRTWVGNAPGDHFGAALLATHDLDADGRADLVIGAPGQGAIFPRAGRVHVYRGGSDMKPHPDWTLEGLQAGEESGSALAAVNALQYAGVVSLAVGAPGSDAGAGSVRIYMTDPVFDETPDLTIKETQPGARFGATLACAGDLDADGRDDLAAGAPLFDAAAIDAGRVSIYRSPVGATPRALMTMTGNQAYEAMGSALSGGADLDADGYDDLAIGSPGYSGWRIDGGRVTVLRGGPFMDPAAAYVIDGREAGARLGTAAAIAGDMNGDGVADLVVGSPFMGPSDAGATQVHYGRPRISAEPDLVVNGRPGDRLGLALSAASDPRAPGLHDALVGAPFADGAVPDVGRIVRIDVERYFLVRPNGGELWQAGTSQTVEWIGEEPAEVQLSLDGGLTYRPLADARVRTHVVVRVPVDASRHARVRVVPANRAVGGAGASDREFEIRSSVRLVNFESEVKPDGVHLAWETDPPPGADGIRGYQLLRSPPESPGQGKPQPGGMTTATRHVDRDARPGTEYTLMVMDASGQWLEMGRITIAGIQGLHLGPVPYRGAGALTIAFETPVDGQGASAADLSVRLYDAAGRQAALLASGPIEARARIVELQWDGRLAGGARAAPGVYFIRVAAPSAAFQLTRRLVIVR